MDFSPRPLIRAALFIALGFIGVTTCLNRAEAASPSPARNNPISKLARLVSPQLAEVEDRVNWLDEQAATLPRYNPFPMYYQLGYRGHRATPDSPDPSITLDFGQSLPIDRVFLIPTQQEYVGDTGIFPIRFTLEIADQAEFSDARVIHRTDKTGHRTVGGYPAAFDANMTGRYLRLSVQQGYNKGSKDVYGLSEIFVFSKGRPISFNAQVSTVGDLEISPVWSPQALTDGRSPLGIWHHGESVKDDIGDVVMIEKRGATTTWRIKLADSQPVDQIILFPYQIRGSYYSSVLPDSLRIELSSPEDPNSMMIQEWNNPIPGSNQHTPLVFAINNHEARVITVTATSHWIMSQRAMHALSEIQVWSQGKNVSSGLPVIRTHEGESIEVKSLTDGYSSERSIAQIRRWLDQLVHRGMIEQELNALSALHSRVATRSELNVSWAAAVLLGLTFLVPVFIFERKRIRAKEHLDLMRKRIAADLHDDIGSNLGSISMIARTARKDLARLKGPAEIDNDLGEVEMIARESSLAMRDIVWLLERKQDSIGDLVHRMRETAGRLLRGVDFSMECTSTKTAAKLTLDAKRHLFLFYKEAIHNIVKHSQATKISIRLWDEGDQLGLEIIDNGVGLPMNGDRASVSVRKLEERADVLGGNLRVDTSPEKGTCIRLLIKRSKLTNQSTSS